MFTLQRKKKQPGYISLMNIYIALKLFNGVLITGNVKGIAE